MSASAVETRTKCWLQWRTGHHHGPSLFLSRNAEDAFRVAKRAQSYNKQTIPHISDPSYSYWLLSCCLSWDLPPRLVPFLYHRLLSLSKYEPQLDGLPWRERFEVIFINFCLWTGIISPWSLPHCLLQQRRNLQTFSIFWGEIYLLRLPLLCSFFRYREAPCLFSFPPFLMVWD